MRVLFASSEAYPLLKTGGLADVSHSLPNALGRAGTDMRLVLPAYREVLRKVEDLQILGWLRTGPTREVRILQGYHPAFDITLWLVDAADLFDRAGNPYLHPDGHDWPDNPERFAVFSHAVALLAIDALKLGWRADVVHANDWQTGLVPAYLGQDAHPPRRVFTIHNLAYDTQFDYGTFQHLRLPPHWWSMDFGEFYGRFSMLKAGLSFADEIITVSPSYAQEIRTPEYGYGFASVLEARSAHLSGIINGIDERDWDPAKDKRLVARYSVNGKIRPAKHRNRCALLKALGAGEQHIEAEHMLFGFVGRLAHQKGVDLITAVIPGMIADHGVNFALVGSGDPEIERHLLELRDSYPANVFVHIGYDEDLAHLLEAGSDSFIMPSRYEPCGLNQMYSLRYGTPPVVRNTGGLADTVVDASDENIENGTATGFVFDHADDASLRDALDRAVDLFGKRRRWMQLIKQGMRQDWSWEKSAQRYLSLYRNDPEVTTHG